MLTVSSPIAPIHAESDERSERVSECLYGETLIKLSDRGQFAEVRAEVDGYCGYVQRQHLEIECAEKNTLSDDTIKCYQVARRSTLLLSGSDIKSAVVAHLPLLSRVELDCSYNHSDSSQKLARTSCGGFTICDHLMDADKLLSVDRVSLAQLLFSGTPYLWGGRTPVGCDCSGMIQAVARLTGINLPRDSGEQEESIKEIVDFEKRTAGDLVFWPGHVGILQSAETLFHANARSMDCRIEQLNAVMKRAGPPSSIRRLSGESAPAFNP